MVDLLISLLNSRKKLKFWRSYKYTQLNDFTHLDSGG